MTEKSIQSKGILINLNKATNSQKQISYCFRTQIKDIATKNTQEYPYYPSRQPPSAFDPEFVITLPPPHTLHFRSQRFPVCGKPYTFFFPFAGSERGVGACVRDDVSCGWFRLLYPVVR